MSHSTSSILLAATHTAHPAALVTAPSIPAVLDLSLAELAIHTLALPDSDRSHDAFRTLARPPWIKLLLFRRDPLRRRIHDSMICGMWCVDVACDDICGMWYAVCGV